MPLKDSIEALDEAVGSFLAGDERDNKAILAAIFGVNNEIGRLLRLAGDPALKALQLNVNEVTKAAKRNDRRALAQSMEKVRAEALRMA